MIKKQPTIRDTWGSLCALCELNTACELLCHACISNLALPTQSCTRCAEPLYFFLNEPGPSTCQRENSPVREYTLHTNGGEPSTQTCGQCLSKPPLFNRTIAALAYVHPCDYLLNTFKQQGNLNFGRWLSRQLADKIQCHYRHDGLPTIIIPTPSYRTSLIKRGFNPAHFIAKELSKTFHLPLHNVLKQLSKTTEQKSLSRELRLKNLRHRFALREKDKEVLQNHHVALVDDVMTTGATANILTKHLKRAGATRVDIWLLARTALPSSPTR